MCNYLNNQLKVLLLKLSPAHIKTHIKQEKPNTVKQAMKKVINHMKVTFGLPVGGDNDSDSSDIEEYYEKDCYFL